MSAKKSLRSPSNTRHEILTDVAKVIEASVAALPASGPGVRREFNGRLEEYLVGLADDLRWAADHPEVTREPS